MLNGQKQFISGAGNERDFYLVMARTEPRSLPISWLLRRWLVTARQAATPPIGSRDLRASTWAPCVRNGGGSIAPSRRA